MEYYYTDGTTNYGPFTIEQLKEKNITASTKVWYSGLSGWTPAGQLPELSGILVSGPPPAAATPPPYHSYSNTGFTQNKPPKTWLVESILVTLFCCLPFGIAGIIYASRVESKFYASDLQGSIQASNDAGKWTKIGFWIGIGFGVLAIIYYIVLIGWIVRNGGDFPSYY